MFVEHRAWMRIAMLAALLLGLGSAAVAEPALSTGYHLVPGQFGPGSSPDGNSIFIDAPAGLILVDTGRHSEHAQSLLDFARARGRPIAAIVNSHWHLDHSSGDILVRAAFPNAPLYASNAVDGALATFLHDDRVQAERQLAGGRLPAARQAEIRHFLDTMDHAEALRPSRPVTRSATLRIAGRRLEVHLARFAATEGDVWLYDPATHVLVAGDLVVSEVPFMDTACLTGWRRALGELAARPFTILIPGHGAPMTRADFLAWRTAFDALADCGGSTHLAADCVAGWRRDAARFIGAGRGGMIDQMVAYYLDSRLRAAPAERVRYCRPLNTARASA